MKSYDPAKWCGQAAAPDKLDAGLKQISRPVGCVLVAALLGASTVGGDSKWAIGRIAADNTEEMIHLAMHGKESLDIRNLGQDVGGQVVTALVAQDLRKEGGQYVSSLASTKVEVYEEEGINTTWIILSRSMPRDKSGVEIDYRGELIVDKDQFHSALEDKKTDLEATEVKITEYRQVENTLENSIASLVIHQAGYGGEWKLVPFYKENNYYSMPPEPILSEKIPQFDEVFGALLES